MHNLPQQTVLFPDLFSKPISVSFSKEHLSSNGGSLLLKAADRSMGLTRAIAETFLDERQPEKIRHEILDLTRQRIFSLASGYPDCNDADQLKQDPILKLLCGRAPITGDDLGSQPTLSRLENSATRGQLLSMSSRVAEVILRRQAQRRQGQRCPRRIIIDLDPTCDPTYGAQQMTLFNGYYDTWCYLPLVLTVSFDGERRKYPIAAILRPGTIKRKEVKGTLSVLRRVIPTLRRLFPSARLYFRADAEFAKPWLLKYLEEEDITYAISIASNSVLKELSSDRMKQARNISCILDESVTLHGEGIYQAGSWPHPRRLAYKAEVLVKDGDRRDNARYVVTNLPGNYGPQGIFTFYYGHSVMENTIKDLKNDLALDRTSCCSFAANQLRLIWSLAAFTLMHSLQEHIDDRELAKATMHTLRARLLKIAVLVRESTRRIVCSFTAHHPWSAIWLRCALSLGAASG